MSSEESTTYTVVIPKTEFAKIEQWGKWATESGVLDDYLVALKTINFRLTNEPHEWGESRYTLHNLGLEIRFGTFSMLNVWYGVSQTKSMVFVKVFQFRGDYQGGSPPD